jgi:hypothetical protein
MGCGAVARTLDHTPNAKRGVRTRPDQLVQPNDLGSPDGRVYSQTHPPRQGRLSDGIGPDASDEPRSAAQPKLQPSPSRVEDARERAFVAIRRDRVAR